MTDTAQKTLKDNKKIQEQRVGQRYGRCRRLKKTKTRLEYISSRFPY